jgi:hypothetical protein
LHSHSSAAPPPAKKVATEESIVQRANRPDYGTFTNLYDSGFTQLELIDDSEGGFPIAELALTMDDEPLQINDFSRTEPYAGAGNAI